MVLVPSLFVCVFTKKRERDGERGGGGGGVGGVPLKMVRKKKL